MIDVLKMQIEHRALIKLIFHLFQLVLILHILGCFWFVIVSKQKLWIPTNDWIDSCCTEYMYSFYWPTTTVTR